MRKLARIAFVVLCLGIAPALTIGCGGQSDSANDETDLPDGGDPALSDEATNTEGGNKPPGVE